MMQESNPKAVRPDYELRGKKLNLAKFPNFNNNSDRYARNGYRFDYGAVRRRGVVPHGV